MQTSTARRSNAIRESFSRRAFLKLNTVFLILVCFLMLYPVVYVIACSFSEETAILRGDVSFLPVQPHVKAYTKVFNYPQLWTSYRNTILYTVLGTFINLILTVCGAWALSQKKMVGRRFFTLMCTFTMFFGGGMIPKIECCVNALERGVHRTHILDGRIPHSILTEMLSHKGIGTMLWE